MEFLVETKDQLDKFFHKDIKDVLIIIIPQNYNYHPALSSVNSLYIRDLNTNKSYIFPFKHTESLNLDVSINDVISNFKKIYTFDKKQQLYFSSQLSDSIDVKFEFNLDYREHFCPTLNYFYKKYPTLQNLNALIPIVKLYELWDKISSNFVYDKINPYTHFASQTITPIFYTIEKNAISIDNNAFDYFFDTYGQQYNIVENTIYSQYNLYNVTTRPSNHFNGINFLALNKSKGERKAFIPKNDILVEMDFSAYHPTLAGKLIGEDFIGYKKIIEELELDESQVKQKVFRFMYGGVKEGLEKIDWFIKIEEFINNLWDEFLQTQKITNPVSGKIFLKSQLENINKQKLFNYFIQSWETSTSVRKLEKIITLLKGKNTQIILYIYDSILLDVDKNERFLLTEIKNILQDGGFKVGISYGPNYDELKKLKPNK